MDNSGSITEFFYNIVPGSIFLFLLKYFELFDVFWFTSDSAAVIFAYIIIGLFLGFVFQGMTKAAREWFGWNESIAKKVKEKNKENEKFFKKSYMQIHDIEDKDYKEPKELTQTFYLMDNVLRGKHAAFQPTHFSSRFAFWSNMLFGIISLIAIRAITQALGCVDIFLVLLAISTFWLANKYFFGFYDSILKCFYMLKVKKDS